MQNMMFDHNKTWVKASYQNEVILFILTTINSLSIKI
jgi:hypothetical protein